MENKLHDYRKSYEKFSLDLDKENKDPMMLFTEWFKEIDENDLADEVNAVNLTTIETDGFPKSRIVLLKSFSKDGFIFYTNYNSDKGQAIAKNNKVNLSFFWPQAERQVIIKGLAEKVDAKESDAYFYSRPKGSQMGAIVSNQSHEIPNREYLEDKLSALEKEVAENNKEIKRPDNWGGYLIKPTEIEFWQGRANRLHDRFLFIKTGENDWSKKRLAP
jgi:pyridoxamine 5'-phosphate oxidase